MTFGKTGAGEAAATTGAAAPTTGAVADAGATPTTGAVADAGATPTTGAVADAGATPVGDTAEREFRSNELMRLHRVFGRNRVSEGRRGTCGDRRRVSS